MLGARSHWSQSATEQSFAADADRVEIGAVNESQSDSVLCRRWRTASFSAMEIAAALLGANRNLVEVARRGLNEAPRERRRGRIGEARAEGRVSISADCVDHLGWPWPS